jgi:hypothetical protein
MVRGGVQRIPVHRSSGTGTAGDGPAAMLIRSALPVVRL